MRETLANQRGMTLAELLVAMAVMSVGLAAIAAAVPLSSYGIQEGNQLSAATFLAGQRLEQVRNAQWIGPAGCSPAAGVDGLGISPSPDGAPEACGTPTFPDEGPGDLPGAYSRQVRIAGCGAGAGCQGIVSDDLRQVIVTVGYRPLTGLGQAPGVKSVTLTMVIAKR